MRVEIENLIFDQWNIQHIARHQVTQNEVEQIFRGQTLVRQSYKDRFLVLGQTEAGRTLAVIIHPKTQRAYYVVTARNADRKERAIYQTEIEQGGEKVA